MLAVIHCVQLRFGRPRPSVCWNLLPRKVGRPLAGWSTWPAVRARRWYPEWLQKPRWAAVRRGLVLSAVTVRFLGLWDRGLNQLRGSIRIRVGMVQRRDTIGYRRLSIRRQTQRYYRGGPNITVLCQANPGLHRIDHVQLQQPLQMHLAAGETFPN